MRRASPPPRPSTNLPCAFHEPSLSFPCTFFTGAPRLAAVEAAACRAVYLLVHSHGRRVVQAAKLPDALRPRLDAFLAEII